MNPQKTTNFKTKNRYWFAVSASVGRPLGFSMGPVGGALGLGLAGLPLSIARYGVG